jgi:hypothetical protein
LFGTQPIEHGSDRIDAQAVDAVAFEPEQRIRREEIGDLGAPVIVDQRIPVEMPALARVLVLIKASAIEAREPVRVVGEMARHPVEQDADAGRMQRVDQRDEIRWRTEAAGGREQTGRLVAPGAVEGMLHHGKHFDMGEAHVGQISGKLLGEIAIGQPLGALALAPPGAEMHLVDRHRRVQRVDVIPRGPRPRQGCAVDHHRGG